MTNECDVCHKVLARPEHLRRHLETHSSRKPFPCEVCGKTFARKDAMQRHGIVHKNNGLDSNVEHARKRSRLVSEELESPRITDEIDVGLESISNDGFPTQSPGTSALMEAGMYAHTAELVAGAQNDSPGQQPSKETQLLPMNWLPYDDQASQGYHGGFSHTSSGGFPDSGQAFGNSPSLSRESGNSPAWQWDDLANPMIPFIAAMGGVSKTSNSIPIAPLATNWDAADAPEERYTLGTGARVSNDESFNRRRLSMRARAGTKAQISGRGTLHPYEWAARNRAFTLTDNVYAEIEERFSSRLRLGNLLGHEGGTERDLPSRASLDSMIQLYFSNFHPVFPFLDQPLLSMPIWGWALCLATAAIGCRYHDEPEFADVGDRLAVTLREMMVKELDVNLADNALPYVQALVLNCVSLTCSKLLALQLVGQDATSSVIQSALRFDLFGELDSSELATSVTDLDQAWMAWRCRETRRRTGLFVWTFDCVSSAIRSSSPLLKIQTMQLMLPSSDKLWAAASPSEWLSAQSIALPTTDDFAEEEQARPSLHQAFSNLWQKHTLVSNISQLASSSLVYALLHRSHDISSYCDDPGRLDAHIASVTVASYIPAQEVYTKWRNTACDYLDVVHWEALANSARNRAHEGPIFLDLHLARMLLLTPFHEFLALSELGKTDTSTDPLPHTLSAARKPVGLQQATIDTWRDRDFYKARLAVIHAGATFWHVRHYPSDSFIQPFAVYLATLVLWHFSFSLARKSEDSESAELRSQPTQSPMDHCLAVAGSSQSGFPQELQPPQSNRASVDAPRYLNIDRPMDDGFVQHFVRNGVPAVTLCAQGVDDICTDTGRRSMVREAASLLRDSTKCSWPLARSYARSLERLALSSE